MNKRKIFNDPVYGFIRIPSDFIFDLINHPYFQRLRRIKQTGLADLVYPGASHTRFQHAIGAMHLMNEALATISEKGELLMEFEKEGALAAILLHDIGHGPFSHVLENEILIDVPHEWLSSQIMNKLNVEFKGALGYAQEMFQNKYPRKFFNQLISSQLDMDRLDYLARDSFFTGVTEGKVGVERIIKMFKVDTNHNLIIENKGILSIESFLHSRRLMYWQVYYHKTSIATEFMLKSIFKRYRFLVESGQKQGSIGENLDFFLSNKISKQELKEDPSILDRFLLLDDHDIMFALKTWQNSNDLVLSKLSSMLLNRKLFKCRFDSKEEPTTEDKQIIKNSIVKKIEDESLHSYFYGSGKVKNLAYMDSSQDILIEDKEGKSKNILEVSDLPTIQALSKPVEKEYFCYVDTKFL